MREDLGTAAEQGWTPEHIAEYFIDAMEDEDYRGPAGRSVRKVLHDFFEAARDSQYETDPMAVGAFLTGHTETYDRALLEDELTDYLAEELTEVSTAAPQSGLEPEDTGESYTRSTLQDQEAGPTLDDGSGAEIESLYFPHYHEIEAADRPARPGDVWMTTVHSVFDLDDPDDVQLTHIEYLEEDEAREAVRHLLAHDQLVEVVDLIEKSIRFGRTDQMCGFTEELVRAEEIADAQYLVTYAKDKNHSSEADTLRKTISETMTAKMQSNTSKDAEP